MSNEHAKGEEGKENLQVRQNKAANFLVRNDLAGETKDSLSKKTVAALAHTQRFEDINPALTSEYVDLINSAARALEIHGEKGKAFFDGLDQILDTFSGSAKTIYEIEKADIEVVFEKANLGKPDLRSELPIKMQKALMDTILTSDLREIFENENDFFELVNALKLSGFVRKLSETFINEDERRKDESRLIKMPEEKTRIDFVPEGAIPIQTRGEDPRLKEFETDEELETLLGAEKYIAYQQKEIELIEKALEEVEEALKSKRLNLVAVLSEIFQNYLENFFLDQDMRKTFSQNPLELDLIRINFERRLRASIQNRVGLIIENDFEEDENSDS